MAGFALQVLAVDVLVGAVLLYHEHLAAQGEEGVQLLLVEFSVVFAAPVDGHVGLLGEKHEDNGWPFRAEDRARDFLYRRATV
ncbi:hypothetical protein D3C78_1760990 [compost metagenome]